MVQLPILIEEYLEKNTIFPLPTRINKATLYSMGFIAPDVKNILIENIGDVQLATLEVQKAAYSKALDLMIGMLQKHPKSELLIFAIAKIYSQVFHDSFKALDYINKLTEKNQSFVGRVSRLNISKKIEFQHQYVKSQTDNNNKQEKIKFSHLSYFAYRKKTEGLKKRIKVEIDDHLRLWKNFSGEEIDILSAITQASLISNQTRNINSYWYKNFEGYETTYVNASLMYGLYLERVHSIPLGGSPFIKKAYSAINNK